ncbi:MAG: hypothetical protein ACYDEY_11790 [Acidimicrobiales bacterium]
MPCGEEIGALEGLLGVRPPVSLRDRRHAIAWRADRVDGHVGATVARVEDTAGRQLGSCPLSSLDATRELNRGDLRHLLCHVAGLREVDRDEDLPDRRQRDGDPDGVDAVGNLVAVVVVDRDEAPPGCVPATPC